MEDVIHVEFSMSFVRKHLGLRVFYARMSNRRDVEIIVVAGVPGCLVTGWGN